MTATNNAETQDRPRPVSELQNGTPMAGTDAASKDGDGQPEQTPKGPEQLETVEGARLMLILVALTTAVFLIMLDLTIVSTAIPKITDDFHQLRSVGWYTTSYQLGSATLQLLTGRMYNAFNLKWTFITLFLIFELGAALSGAAQSSTMLIVSRAISGIGAAGLFNGGLTILAACVPLEKRPITMGIMIGFSQVGVVIGPLIGGALTTNVSWRWCFYINLPIASIVLVPLLLLHIPNQVQKPPVTTVLRRANHYFDLVGLALYAPAIIMLLLAMELGVNKDHAWNSSQVIGLFVGSGVTAIVWLAWNATKGRDGLLPMPVVRQPVVWISGLNYMALTICITGTAAFLPLYFQSVLEASPITSGVYMLAAILPQVAASLAGGPLVQRIGRIPVVAVTGAVFSVLGTGLSVMLSPTTPKGHWVGFMILMGIGRGLGSQLAILAGQFNVSSADVAPVMAFMIWCQYIGPVVFLTIANILFDSKLVSAARQLVPDIDPETVLAAGATGFRAVVRPDQVPGILVAFSKGVDNVFYLLLAAALVCFITSWGMGWKDIRKKSPAAAAKPAEPETAGDEELGEGRKAPTPSSGEEGDMLPRAASSEKTL